MAERTEPGSQGADAEANSNVPQANDPSVGRRDFLRGTVAVGIGAGLAATSEAAQAKDNDLFQPQEYWQDRMTAPDDGKRLGWFVDLSLIHI